MSVMRKAPPGRATSRRHHPDSLEDVHAEACRWEHVMSEDVERRLVQKCSTTRWCVPFGNRFGTFAAGPEQRRPGSGCGSGSTDRIADRWPRPGDRPTADRARPGRCSADRSAWMKPGVVPNARVLVETRADGSVTIMIAGRDNVDLPITWLTRSKSKGLEDAGFRFTTPGSTPGSRRRVQDARFTTPGSRFVARTPAGAAGATVQLCSR